MIGYIILVLRGGSWLYYPNNLRASDRYRSEPDYRSYNYGFRLVVRIKDE